jgi:hypothetical protein
VVPSGSSSKTASGSRTWKWGSQLERRAEALDEGHRPGEGPREAQSPSRASLEGEERADEEAECPGEEAGVPGEAEPERYGEGERPLAVRGPGQHAFDEVERRVVRPAGVAGGAHPAGLAGEWDEHLGPASPAGQPGKAVGEYAAGEVTGEVPPDKARQPALVRRPGEKARELTTHHPMEEGALRVPAGR